MAETPEDQGTALEAAPMDYPEHERTYKLFITLSKWGLGLTAIVLVLMGAFLIDAPAAGLLIIGVLLLAAFLYLA